MKKPLAQRVVEFLFGRRPEPDHEPEYTEAEKREYDDIVEQIRKEMALDEPEILLTAAHKVAKPKKKAKKPERRK